MAAVWPCDQLRYIIREHQDRVSDERPVQLIYDFMSQHVLMNPSRCHRLEQTLGFEISMYGLKSSDYHGEGYSNVLSKFLFILGCLYGLSLFILSFVHYRFLLDYRHTPESKEARNMYYILFIIENHKYLLLKCRAMTPSLS